MRVTDTHVYFWFGPFSNWSKSTLFSGARALDELRPLLDAQSYGYPQSHDPMTVAIASHSFVCGEQWMMAIKAWVFRDATRLEMILAESEPKRQKALGREVTNFEPKFWDAICVPVVAAGTIARFEVNPRLLKQMLDTGDRAFVEGSPFDRLWGVGIRWDDPKIEDQRNWRGKNLLGQAHAISRNILAQRHQR